MQPNDATRRHPRSTVKWGRRPPFAMVPKWVYRSDVSDRAVRLYAVLTGYASGEQETFQGKRQLSADLRCAKSSVERALADLVRIGAVTVERTVRDDGGNGVNSYVVHGDYPRPDQSGHPPPDQSGTDPLLGDPKANREGTTTDVVVPGRLPQSWVVNRVKVTDHEMTLANLVLMEWNRQAGQLLGSRDWLSKIVMRVREHPDLTADDHADVIRAALADPWWKGPATPSVVYGSGAQFERSMLARGQRDPVEEAYDVAARVVDETRGES